MSRDNGPKKSRMGRPPVDSEPVKLRVERQLLNAIDAFRAPFSNISRQAAIMFIIEREMERRGFLAERKHSSATWLQEYADKQGYSDSELREAIAQWSEREGIRPSRTRKSTRELIPPLSDEKPPMPPAPPKK